MALRLAAYSALYRRLLVERRNAMLHIASAKDIYDRYAAELREYKVEAAVLLMLDQQHNVIRDAWFCTESPNSADIRIVDLLRPAVREYAVNVALVHNHPSGSTMPSRADDGFTKKLADACRIFDLGLLDHVIVTDSGQFAAPSLSRVLKKFAAGEISPLFPDSFHKLMRFLITNFLLGLIGRRASAVSGTHNQKRA